MKKLMIGLVGALAMVASAEVTSSNVVGYDVKPIENYQFVGSAFLNCIGEKVDLTIGELNTNCDMTGEVGTGWQALTDCVVMLSETGSFVRNLVFLPGYIADEIGAEEGWYDVNDTNEEDFTTKWDNTEIPFGKGIQVSAGAGAEISFAGEVKVSPTVIDVEGYMIIANCAPKNLKLGDLVTNCDMTGELGTGWQALTDCVVMLSETGSFVRNLVFLPEYIADEIGAEQGWYDVNDANEENFTDKWDNKIEWQSGDAFQVSAGSGAAIIVNSAL